jgi:hypothetical protein
MGQPGRHPGLCQPISRADEIRHLHAPPPIPK